MGPQERVLTRSPRPSKVGRIPSFGVRADLGVLHVPPRPPPRRIAESYSSFNRDGSFSVLAGRAGSANLAVIGDIVITTVNGRLGTFTNVSKLNHERPLKRGSSVGLAAPRRDTPVPAYQAAVDEERRAISEER